MELFFSLLAIVHDFAILNSPSLTIMSYKNLAVWQLSRQMVIDIHKMSVRLPKFEQFEEAQQIRRSSKSVRSTIVEGYGRRRYKAEFIKFLVYAIASNDETIDHLEMLNETGSLSDTVLFNQLHDQLLLLGKKLNNFITAVEKSHNHFPVPSSRK